MGLAQMLLRAARQAKLTADHDLKTAVRAAVDEGVPYAEIAKHAGISIRTVSRWKDGI